MRERVAKIELADVQLSVIMFDEAFCMKKVENSKTSLQRLKAVHKHSNHEIFFVTKGKLTVATEKDAISCENSMVIIPPLFEHYTVGSEFEGYTLNFIMEKKPTVGSDIYEKISEAFACGPTVLPLTQDEIFYIDHIALCLGDKLPENTLFHFVYLLFSEMLSRIAPPQHERSAVSKKQAKYINVIETYVTYHYFENIGLEEVAKEVGLCKKQISRIVQKEYGCSFPELVTRHRMSAACMLLKHTPLHIYEVAENVGYRNHENYFCALFKKNYGVTPTQYRKESREP